ncbi:MAG: mechanosensitive ion channel [Aquabacterium sp.]
MDAWNRLLGAMGDTLGPYAPRVLGALVIVAVAWVLARVVQVSVLRLAERSRLDERLHNPGMAALLANVARWLVWLFALPALLGTLELKGLLDPVNAMLSRLLGFAPQLLGALVILGVGLVLGGILRQIVSGLLKAAGSEKLAARLGLGAALGEAGLAGIAGSVVYVLVLLPTVAGALQALGLEAVSRPVGQLLDKVFDLIPRLFSAGLIVGIAALIGRALASVVSGLLAGLGFNALPQRLGLPSVGRGGRRDASELAGGLVMAAIVYLALVQACEVIGFHILTEAVAALGGVLVRVAVALLLAGVGLWLATLAADAVRNSAMRHAGVVATLVRAAILFFTAALALHQAGLPAVIVTIAFTAVVGAIAVGLAVAVGVGGRHVAARLLERAVDAFDGKPRAGDDQSQQR